MKDYEMGSEDNASPKINKYTNDIKPKQNTEEEKQGAVDPAGEAPPAAPATPEAAGYGQMPSTELKTGQKPQENPKKVPNPEARKKALLGCLGAFGVVVALFLILAIVVIARTGESTNPIARLLGLDQALFVNSLITLVHVSFILVSLLAFVLTMMGLFKASMAKKEDKIVKKEGLKMSLIFGIGFMVVIIIWGFIYLYLDAKRIQLSPEETEYGIVTEPEETYNLTVPIEIRFDGSNLPIDSKKYQIISYKWDFGDGETGTKQIEKHTYKEKGKEGRYEVVLTVTFKDKKTDEEQAKQFKKTITVADEALYAAINADPQSGEVPLKVKFDASDSGDPDSEIARYEWDLDEDGEFDDAKGPKIEYEFDKVGKYTVALRVTSGEDEFAIAEKEIVVKEKGEADAVITVVDEPTTYTKGVQYVFKADESSSEDGDIVEYEWDFGDNDTKTTKTVSYIFDKEGTYEIKLKVTDENGKEGETAMTITVGVPKGSPKAKINTNPGLSEGGLTLTGKIPFQVTFDAYDTTDSDNNIADYTWDFDGDGFVDDYGTQVTHTFIEEGTYTVTLKVSDNDNNLGVAKMVVNAEKQGITAAMVTSKAEGSVPLIVTFDASSSSYNGGSISSYKWDFGDGTSPKLGAAKISHKYTEIGIYTASVTVIGSDNSTSTKEVLVTVREIPLNACFEPVFTEGEAPLETSFDPGCSLGTISSYFWDFGDGATSTEVKPTHKFTKAGEYPVKLEISDSEKTVSETIVTITVIEKK